MSTQQQLRQPESLARAKASLKERLMQKMKQEVLDEMQDTDSVVAEVMEALQDQSDVLSEVKKAFKARLLSQVRKEVVSEVAREVEKTALEGVVDQEVVSEAKDRFKVRLIDHILQQAVSEVSSEAGWAQDALEVHAGGDIVREAKDTFKARLSEYVFDRAVEEVGTELGGQTEALVERADAESLADAKMAIKQRLLDHVLHQAIAEIDAEVDVTPEEYMDFADEIEEAIDVDEVVDQVYEDITQELSSEADAASESVEAAEAAIASSEADDPVVPSSMDVQTISSDLEEDEDGFFLGDQSEPGNESATESDDDSDQKKRADFSGDGAWEPTMTVIEKPPDFIIDDEVNNGINNFVQDDENSQNEEKYLLFGYGIMSGIDLDNELLPQHGIDASFAIFPVVQNHASALVSKVSAEAFGAAVREKNMADPDWIAQHSGVFDELIDELTQLGAFIPFPFGSIYDSEAEVRRMLSEISYLDALEKIQGRSQWRLQVYRNVDVLHQQVVEKSPVVQRLMTDIKSQPKGGGNAIKKQMVTTIREEEAAFTDNCTEQVHERLYAYADDVELGSLDGAEERDKLELILDASYLVHREKHEVFRADVDQLIAEYAPFGFEFKVNGPEPPTLFSRFHPSEKTGGVA